MRIIASLIYYIDKKADMLDEDYYFFFYHISNHKELETEH